MLWWLLSTVIYATKIVHRLMPFRDTPTLISGLACAGVTAIDAGDDHSVALAADGRLWTWGQGTFGALGHETNESQHTPQQVAALMHTQIMSMAAGGHHTVALSAKGRVYTWGSNTDGQLGVGNCIDASLPCVVEDSSSLQVSQVCGPTVLADAAKQIDCRACLH